MTTQGSSPTIHASWPGAMIAKSPGPYSICFAAVGHDDLHPAGDEVAGVRGLAGLGAGDRLDVCRPAPAGLEGGPADRSGVEVDQFELAAAVLERADLFGLVQALADQCGRFS